jgi:hypothetical protein
MSPLSYIVTTDYHFNLDFTKRLGTDFSREFLIYVEVTVKKNPLIVGEIYYHLLLYRQ